MAPTTYYYYSPNHVAFMKVEDIVRLRLPLPVGCKFWFRPHLRTLKFLFSSLVVTLTLNLAEIHVCVLTEVPSHHPIIKLTAPCVYHLLRQPQVPSH